MYSSELMSINETVACPFLTSCNVSLDLERETKNIGARRIAKSSIIFRTQKFRYNKNLAITNPNSKSPIKGNIELDNADPLSNMVQPYEEIL